MSLLGIDVGTTGCKAAAFSVKGETLVTAYREYTTIHPRDGWAELDSRRVLACVWETIKEVASRTARDPVSALCVSSLGEAMTPVSQDREILGTCILSSDVRGAEYLEGITREMGPEAFYEINPNILGPNYSLPKLLWLRHNQPELFDKAHKFLLWVEMVGFMLGGEPLTSYSLANRTLLFDIRQEDWSDRLLALSGIAREKLPRPAASGTIAGTISNQVAATLGLPKGVVVVVGGHDQCCNSLGAGIYKAGSAVCGIGTYECITPTYDHIPDAAPMLKQGLNIEHHLFPHLYVSFIYNQGGSLVRWFRDTFAARDNKLVKRHEDIFDLLSREMPSGPTRLLTLPYFEITGPPGFLADVSGVILGLKTSTTRGEILKSIMECETMYFVDSIQALKAMGMDTSEFVATGGGAKSDQWLQIKADIFGVPFVRPRIIEASLLGAAMLAGVATNVFASPAEAVAQFVKRLKVFEPDPVRHALYQEKLEDYRALFPLLQHYLAKLERRERSRIR